ncbi:uncharacterized protein [Littorina saxatilis]|uniref:uncharacterized protein n=1 Tax=Littorina saxatilis TaxID=31220 RepID=UPI0038B67A77
MFQDVGQVQVVTVTDYEYDWEEEEEWEKAWQQKLADAETALEGYDTDELALSGPEDDVGRVVTVSVTDYDWEEEEEWEKAWQQKLADAETALEGYDTEELALSGPEDAWEQEAACAL